LLLPAILVKKKWAEMLLNVHPERGAQRHGSERAGQSGISCVGQENLLNSEEFEEELRLEVHGVRFRIYPTRIQEQVLKRWIGSQRYLYNRKVEELDYQLTLKNFGKFSNRFEEPEETYCE
jgi:Helix-turn-helix domain